MRVKVTFTNTTSMFGTLPHDDYTGTLNAEDFLPWVMNDERNFIPFIQPNGKEILLSKNAIAYIVEDTVEDIY